VSELWVSAERRRMGLKYRQGSGCTPHSEENQGAPESLDAMNFLRPICEEA
jgi:hypothetical protein